MLLHTCVLIHENVPRETIQLYHLNLNILTHSNNNSLFQSYVHMYNKNIIIKNTYIQLINKYITVKKK